MAAKVLSLKDLLADESPKERISETSFEDGLRLLGELVEKVESGSLPLDRAIAAYERGAFMVEHLRQLISGAEAKLKVLARPQK
ncbi:MAG: exodeoxyribonuclease VII small subunit [Oligoflexia bacterium]|nr:exodeoxyribonuclease VII small subunit [Oligoflexia bacterium]